MTRVGWMPRPREMNSPALAALIGSAASKLKTFRGADMESSVAGAKEQSAV
jgi:hypothetical protein